MTVFYDWSFKILVYVYHMHVPSRQTEGIIEIYSTLNGSRMWEHSGFIPTKFCRMKNELHSINC